MPIKNSKSIITVIGQLTDQLREMKVLMPLVEVSKDRLLRTPDCSGQGSTATLLKDHEARVDRGAWLHPLWRVSEEGCFVNVDAKGKGIAIP